MGSNSRGNLLTEVTGEGIRRDHDAEGIRPPFSGHACEWEPEVDLR